MRSLGIRLILALLRLLGRMPLALLDTFGAWVGELMWRLGTRARGVVEVNLELCLPALSPAEREQLAHAAMREFGRNVMAMLHAWFATPERVLTAITAIEGEDVLKQALAEGNGVIVLAPHLGNWEVLGVHLGHHYQCTNMYLPARKNVEFSEAVLRARVRAGGDVAPADAGGVRTVLKTLKAGRVVGILPDQEPKLAGAEFAPFFGQPGLTMTLVSNLLQRTGARAVFAAAIRQPHDHRYRLVFQPADAELYAEDLGVSLTALNRGVERLVALAPAQYQWEYKRFKARLPGRPNPYKGDR